MDFRPLFEEIVSWRSTRAVPSLYYEFLEPWLVAHEEHTDWLMVFGSRAGEPIPSATVEDLWDLYSISRVNDLLLTTFQSPPTGDFDDRDMTLWVGGAEYFGRKTDRWNLSLDQYVQFMNALGFSARQHPTFTPTLHEIVEVSQHQDRNHPITLAGEFWPAFMLGNMVFSRAGVLVEGGATYVSKLIAEHSALFWTWLRRHRRTEDLSKGWGSNSQWRTDFRRDYVIGALAHLNVDAKQRHFGPDDLNEEQRREILMHRCLVKGVAPSPAEDLWPYDETAVVPFP